MAKRGTTSVRLDPKIWITLVQANARHQADNGSKGIARDLLKAIRTGELEFIVHEAATSKWMIIPSHQLSGTSEKVLFADTITDALHGTLADFAGWKAVLKRVEFEKWIGANRGKSKSRQPMRQPVEELLKKLFPPKGVPPENILDRELYRIVCREFEKLGQKSIPSNETIRRAAGRRES